MGRNRYVPQAVSLVSYPLQNSGAVFEDLDVFFVEHSNTIIIAKLPNGNERGVGNAVQEMGLLRRSRKMGVEGQMARMTGLNSRAVW